LLTKAFTFEILKFASLTQTDVSYRTYALLA